MTNNEDIKKQNECIQKIESIVKDLNCEDLHIVDKINLGNLTNTNKSLKYRIEC